MNLHHLKSFYFTTFANLLIIIGFLFLIISFGPIIKDELWFYLKEFKHQAVTITPTENSVTDSTFARFLSTRPILMTPVNKDFSIIIERIGVNAPIVPNVPVTDNTAYLAALNNGVAHASTSDFPSSEPGNVYLFAHASLGFWRLGAYAQVFNLLNKLQVGDRVHLFYKGQDFVYEVIGAQLVPGWDTYPIKRPVIEPILTLQTCDPPGTTINRFVVTAKLLEVK